jgi:acetate kinase
MQILVLNCGSSSVKAALYEGGKSAGADSASSELKKLATLHLKIKSTGNHSLAISRYAIDGGDGADGADAEHVGAGADARVQTSESALTGEREDATVKAIQTLLDKNTDIDLIVHRIVHGGAYTEPRMLTSEVITQIKALSEFAPLHNPVSMQAIEAMQVALPAVPQAACFDTAFHRTIPQAAALYALPRAVSKELQIERYGFHGINCQYIVERLCELTSANRAQSKDPSNQEACSTRRAPRNSREYTENTKVLVCHLGAGASLTAIVDGKSVNNTMGFTPLDGLVMGTRVGAIDPGAVLYLMRKQNLSIEDAEKYLNSSCGLKGLAGESDMQKVEELAAKGNSQASEAGKANEARIANEAREALAIYQHRLKTQAGAMIASMGGLDAIVFTGGIGEHSATVRAALCRDLDYMGVILDDSLNTQKASDRAQDRTIHTNESTVQIWVIAANEELFMAKQMLAMKL